MVQALDPIDRMAIIGYLLSHRFPQTWRIFNQ
jgi:hypothetical protein